MGNQHGSGQPDGPDLRVRARHLHALYERTFSAGPGEPVVSPDPVVPRPRPVVARSWQRMRASGLVPEGRNTRHVLSAAELDLRRQQAPVAQVLPTLRAVLGPAAQDSPFVLVLSDADGFLLWREGAAPVLRQADRLGFQVGSRWTEEEVGTNAIGTALAEAAPVQLFSAEHFEQTQHPWYCTAAPIHHPATGELLGVVDVSGPAMTLHPSFGALVAATVRLAEQQLAEDHRSGLGRLATLAAPVTATTRGPFVLLDADGWVAASSGVAVPERLQAPVSGQPAEVPGLGLCHVEPLAGGWLLRPRGSAAPVIGRLDLTARPVLELNGDDEPWRVVLSARHGQILQAVVAAGPEGISAAGLSVQLFGDAEHVVSVRAEVSRLRRTVGALLSTNPYRLADGVHLQVIG